LENGRVHQVNISDGGVPKLPILEARVSALGVEGDRQATPDVHGGPERALCLFSLEEIERLAGEGHPITPGSIGENVTISGIDWSGVKPGTRMRLGEELSVEITDYAYPCNTIKRSFKGGDMNLVNSRLGRASRVYARVLHPGAIRQGDAIQIET